MNNILAISLSLITKLRATSGDFQKWLRRRWTNWIFFYFLRLKMDISMISCECAPTALALSIVSSRENILFFTLHIFITRASICLEKCDEMILSARGEMRTNRQNWPTWKLRISQSSYRASSEVAPQRILGSCVSSGHHESDCRIQRKEAHRCERVNYSLSSRQLKQEKLRSSSKAAVDVWVLLHSPKRWRMRLVLCVQEEEMLLVSNPNSMLFVVAVELLPLTIFVSENLEVTTQLFVQKKHSPSNNYHFHFHLFRSIVVDSNAMDKFSHSYSINHCRVCRHREAKETKGR